MGIEKSVGFMKSALGIFSPKGPIQKGKQKANRKTSKTFGSVSLNEHRGFGLRRANFFGI